MNENCLEFGAKATTFNFLSKWYRSERKSEHSLIGGFDFIDDKP